MRGNGPNTHGAAASWVLLILLIAPTSLAQEPLCGIHALYTAALMLGQEPRLADLLQTEFVGSERGSSLAELEKAAAKLGLHSVPVTKLSTNDLRWCALPVILHVKTDLASSDYNHFVLFAGMHEGKARIFDGTNEVAHWTVGAASLAALLFAIFSIGQSSILLRGISADCGCFGAGSRWAGCRCFARSGCSQPR